MEVATRVQNLDKAVCIRFQSNTLGKGVNPSVCLPAKGK